MHAVAGGIGKAVATGKPARLQFQEQAVIIEGHLAELHLLAGARQRRMVQLGLLEHSGAEGTDYDAGSSRERAHFHLRVAPLATGVSGWERGR